MGGGPDSQLNRLGSQQFFFFLFDKPSIGMVYRNIRVCGLPQRLKSLTLSQSLNLIGKGEKLCNASVSYPASTARSPESEPQSICSS